MTQRQAFEDALKANPYDEVTHRVFADWLNENGFDEEAEHHRLWTKEWQEAYDWMEDFASKGGTHNENYGEEYIYNKHRSEKNPLYIDKTVNINVDMLLAAATRWAKTCYQTVHVYEGVRRVEGEQFVQLGDESLRDNMDNETTEKFWKCYEIITRTTVEDFAKENPFSCFC